MENKEFVKLGDILHNRFKVINRLGKGGCGAVYECLDTKTKTNVAMKIEAGGEGAESTLKMEFEILKALENKRNVAKIIFGQKKQEFCYIVMTLLGKNLNDLLILCGSFKISTLARIGVQLLYGLKNLHDVGFIHRDMKPGNIAIGRSGVNQKIIHILDFGLSRRFKEKGNSGRLIPSRKVVLFRGTILYCSLNAQDQKEQTRGDDLISLAYLLGSFIKPLPWEVAADKLEVTLFKEALRGKDLFPGIQSLSDFYEYVKNLNQYENEPDYEKIFHFFNKIILETKVKFSDPYEWEAILDKETESKKKKPNQSVQVNDPKKADLDNIYVVNHFKRS